MNRAEESSDAPDGWAHVGRAAEDFARRVARDATRFAERLQEHSSEFAGDVSRQWRRSRHRAHRRHDFGPATQGDVRRVFEDIRGLVSDVLDGIDELIGSVFPAATPDSAVWEKVVSNRDVVCSECTRPIAVGDEAYVCPDDAGVDYRCQTCGNAEPSPAGSPS